MRRVKHDQRHVEGTKKPIQMMGFSKSDVLALRSPAGNTSEVTLILQVFRANRAFDRLRFAWQEYSCLCPVKRPSA